MRIGAAWCRWTCTETGGRPSPWPCCPRCPRCSANGLTPEPGCLEEVSIVGAPVIQEGRRVTASKNALLSHCSVGYLRENLGPVPGPEWQQRGICSASRGLPASLLVMQAFLCRRHPRDKDGGSLYRTLSHKDCEQHALGHRSQASGQFSKAGLAKVCLRPGAI